MGSITRQYELMKVILKIEEYLPERNSVVVKINRLHSNKSIDELGAKVVNCNDLNIENTELFFESLANKISHRINIQESCQPILDDNQPDEIVGDLDFSKLIGKVVQTRITNGLKTIGMRRIEL